LRVDGPATASELARKFGESSGATSYHLRQLARYGFIVDDDVQPSRRVRRWRAAGQATTVQIADFIDDPAGRNALRALERLRVQLITERLERWYTERHEWPRTWLEAAEESEVLLRLRPEDLARLIGELWAVLNTYIDAPREVGDPDAENVLLHLYAMPSRDPVGFEER
jgi:DNA-binding transcriptional ArsR family regulator